MKPNTIKLLDCTIRDGGYYNKWYFDDEFLINYINNCVKAKIDIIELGFRFIDNKNLFGPFAYTKESYIRRYNIPKNIEYAVIINAKEYYGLKKNELDRIFCDSKDSIFKYVRVAVNFNEYFKCKNIVDYLNKKGYLVCLNLMQPYALNDSYIINTIKVIKDWNSVFCLYFADSFGSLDNNEIKKLCKIFRKFWDGNLGIHAHNNRGFAISNTLVALNEGFNYFDSTLDGFGRGAGNTETEKICVELNEQFNKNFDIEALIPTLTLMEKIKKKYNWGFNIYYQYAAINNIHPSYVQSIIEDKRYGKEDTLNIIKRLSKSDKLDRSKFQMDYFEKLIESSPMPKKLLPLKTSKTIKNCILLGSGEGFNHNKEGLVNLISNTKLKCYTVNFINLNLNIDGIFSSNIIRILSDLSNYINHKSKYKKLITPFLKNEINYISNKKINHGYYPVKFNSKKSLIYKNYSYLQTSLSIEYALSFLISNGYNNIYLGGFDGVGSYHEIDKINNIIKLYEKKYNLTLHTFTKSRYNIKELSLYSI